MADVIPVPSCCDKNSSACLPATSGEPTWIPHADQQAFAYDSDTCTLWVYQCGDCENDETGEWVNTRCAMTTLPLCDINNQLDVAYICLNGTFENTASIARVNVLNGQYEILVNIPGNEKINALAFNYRKNILYFYGTLSFSVYSYDLTTGELIQNVVGLGLPPKEYEAGAYDIVLDRYILASIIPSGAIAPVYAVETVNFTGEVIGDIDLTSYPISASDFDIEVDPCGNFYLFSDNEVLRFEKYTASTELLVSDIPNTSGGPFVGYGKQGDNFTGIYTNNTFFKYGSIDGELNISPELSVGVGNDFLSGNFLVNDFATSPAITNVPFLGTYSSDIECVITQAICHHRPDGSKYVPAGIVFRGECGSPCDLEIAPPSIAIDRINGIACVRPSQSLPVGSAQLGNVILTSTDVSPIEQEFSIVISDISGGEGGPYNVDFSNVSVSTSIQQITPSVINRTGTPEITIANNVAMPITTGIATMIIKAKQDGNYYYEGDGTGEITINFGSYVIITDVNGNTRNLYLPSGNEGVTTCGDFTQSSGPYIDGWDITGFVFGDLAASVCVQPSNEIPSGGVNPETQLGDVSLGSLSIDPAEQTMVLGISGMSGGDGGPYTADFSNVSVTTFIRQTTPSLIDRTAAPVIAIGAESMTIQVQSNGSYDPEEDGEAGISIDAGSYIVVSDAFGNQRNFYIPTGGEGVLTCGNYPVDQGAYADNWLISGFVFSTLSAKVCIAPSIEIPQSQGAIVSPAPPNPPVVQQLPNVTLTQSSIGEAEQTMTIVVNEISGGDGGPYTVDFSNISFITAFFQTSPSLIDRTGVANVIIGSATMQIRCRSNGLYDTTEDGLAGLTISDGSYIVVTDVSGNAKNFYTPTGNEGSLICGDFNTTQGEYVDNWVISGFTGTASLLTGRLCIAPSNMNLGSSDPASGGNNQLNDIILSAADIAPAEQSLFVVLDGVVGGDGGPYAIDWSNINDNTFFNEGVSDKSAPSTLSEFYSSGSAAVFPGGTSYAHVEVKNNSDGSYDTEIDGEAGIIINGTGYVTVSDSSGNSVNLYTPIGANGNPDCGSHLSPRDGFSYTDTWDITGFDAGGGVQPIEALVCMSPSIGFPGHPVDGGAGTEYSACDLNTSTLEQCENEVSVIVENITGGDGGPYVVDFAGVTWGNSIIEIDPTVDRADPPVITTDPGAGAVVTAVGVTYQTYHPNINPAYDLTKDGFVTVTTLAGSFVTVTDAALNTVTLYLPSGQEGTSVACQVNTSPQSDYFESWGLLGTALPPPEEMPLSASLFIAPSIGDPGWPGNAAITGGNQLSTIVTCQASGLSDAMQPLSVSIQNVQGGDGGPYTVDFSGLIFSYELDETCPGTASSNGVITPIYHNYAGASSNPIRTGVASGQRQLVGDIIPFAQGTIPDVMIDNVSWLVTMKVSGSVIINDSSLNSIELFVPLATQGGVGGTTFIVDQGVYEDSYIVDCSTCDGAGQPPGGGGGPLPEFPVIPPGGGGGGGGGIN